MPEPSSLIINQVLARVRDPGGSMHSRALCQDLLTRLQWLYNNQSKLVLRDFTLTLAPTRLLYSLTEATGDAIQGMTILKMTHNNRPLDRLTLTQLRAMDPRWPRAVGSRLEGFIQLGYTLVLVWPALPSQDTATVTATQLTADLTSQDLLDIPSQSTSYLAQLLELLLLLRQRDMMSFQALMQQLNPRRDRNGTTTQAQGTPEGMVP